MTFPRPEQVRAAVATALLADGELLALLTAQAPWNDPDGEHLTANAILPAAQADKAIPRYITIQSGPMPRGELVSWQGFFYLRVYDVATADYIKIDLAVGRIMKDLDRVRLPMANTVAADTRIELISEERFDEGLNQIYREVQLNLVLL